MPTTTQTQTASVPKPEPKNDFKANYYSIEGLLKAIKEVKEKRAKKPEIRDEGLEKIKKIFDL
jgi:hypothetical protein